MIWHRSFLVLDALERDLKREKTGLEPTTVVTREPTLFVM